MVQARTLGQQELHYCFPSFGQMFRFAQHDTTMVQNSQIFVILSVSQGTGLS